MFMKSFSLFAFVFNSRLSHFRFFCCQNSCIINLCFCFCFCDVFQIDGVAYDRKAAYPPPELTRRLALINIFGFRRRNWRFDVLGATVYDDIFNF
jgi:hypothetical protein